MNMSACRSRVAAAGIFGMIMLVGGQACLAQSAPKPQPAPATTWPSTKIPPSIDDAGEFAENIYDAAKAEDWKLAAKKLDSFKESIGKLSTEIPYMTVNQTKSKGDLDADATALEKAVSGKDKQAAMERANDATAVAATMAGPFGPKIPSNVTKLDYLGRELEVWAGRDDSAKLQKTASSIQSTWNKVRPMIEAKGAGDVAKKFSEAVAQVSAAKTSKEYEAAAVPLLNQVDDLEHVFK